MQGVRFHNEWVGRRPLSELETDGEGSQKKNIYLEMRTKIVDSKTPKQRSRAREGRLSINASNLSPSKSVHVRPLPSGLLLLASKNGMCAGRAVTALMCR